MAAFAALILLGVDRVGAATTLPPGGQPCFTNVLPAGYGSYWFVRSATFGQTGTGVATEVSPSAALVSAELASPAAYVVSNAIVAGPSGFVLPLAYRAGVPSAGSTNFASEAASISATPAGAWNTSFQLSFTNGESFVGFFPYLLSSNLPPVPQVMNFEAAQSIDAGSAFTLAWTPWIGSGTNDRVSLAIVDGAGTTVYSAATDCGGSTNLAAGASEVQVPAGRLAAGTSYTGYLTFGANLLASTDDGALIVERAYHSRTTRFPLRTAGGGGSVEPGSFGPPTISGTNLVFVLTGTPGGTYAIEGSGDFTTWIEETRVTISPTGTVEVRLPLPAGGVPRFYRAVGIGGGTIPGTEARLGISLGDAGQIRLSIGGTSGATYVVETTTNFATWTDYQNVTVPSGSTNVVITIPMNVGAVFAGYRARTASGPPPPTGKQPTLELSVTGGVMTLRVSGGDANRGYTVQRASANLTTWTDTALSVTTDANGQGQATVPPTAGAVSEVFRTVAR